MAKVGLIGLGAMGSRMAQNLLKAGHQLALYNRSPPARDQWPDATIAASPKEAAQDRDFVVAMVSDDVASQSIWFGPQGALAGLSRNTIAIESSTLSPAYVQRLSKAVVATGAAFLDAPVVGSRPQAEAAQLIYLVGGSPETFARAESFLASMGARILHVGENGQGATLKLAINTLFGIQVAAFAEAFGFLQKAGLDLAAASDILLNSPLTSPAALHAAKLMLAQNFEPMFPIALVEKDFRYALETAAAVGADLPTAKAVHGVFQNAKDHELGASNIGAVAKLYLSQK